LFNKLIILSCYNALVLISLVTLCTLNHRDYVKTIYFLVRAVIWNLNRLLWLFGVYDGRFNISEMINVLDLNRRKILLFKYSNIECLDFSTVPGIGYYRVGPIIIGCYSWLFSLPRPSRYCLTFTRTLRWTLTSSSFLPSIHPSIHLSTHPPTHSPTHPSVDIMVGSHDGL